MEVGLIQSLETGQTTVDIPLSSNITKDTSEWDPSNEKSPSRSPRRSPVHIYLLHTGLLDINLEVTILEEKQRVVHVEDTLGTAPTLGTLLQGDP